MATVCEPFDFCISHVGIIKRRFSKHGDRKKKVLISLNILRSKQHGDRFREEFHKNLTILVSVKIHIMATVR